MEREYDIGHVSDPDHRIVGFIGVDMGPWRDNLHFHGLDLGRREEILFDHAEAGDGGLPFGRIDEDRHPARRMDGGVHDADAGHDLSILPYYLDLVVFCDLEDEILNIAKIQGMRIPDGQQLLFVDIEAGLGAFVVIFAVIGMEMGMNDDVNIRRGQIKPGQPLFQRADFPADGSLSLG